MKITTVYFSATYTTHRIVSHLAKRLSEEVKEYDITNNAPSNEIIIPKDELLIVGIPVYAGRVPKMAVDRIRQFKGEGSPAIAVAVYGNRHYDDALLELSDLLSENGFQIISAGAFIAQHSIFPKVGAHRPDADDYLLMNVFGLAEVAAEFAEMGRLMTFVTLLLGNATFFLLDKLLGKKLRLRR